MPNSPRSSCASVSCRLDWTPSRLLQIALIVLGAGAGGAVLASEMPRWAAWPLAIGALLHGLWLARREARAGRHVFFFPGGERPPRVDGEAVRELRVVWRGPLAILHWQGRDGRWQRRSCWPDTLPPERRRELRLAAGDATASRRGRAMAP